MSFLIGDHLPSSLCVFPGWFSKKKLDAGHPLGSKDQEFVPQTSSG